MKASPSSGLKRKYHIFEPMNIVSIQSGGKTSPSPENPHYLFIDSIYLFARGFGKNFSSQVPIHFFFFFNERNKKNSCVTLTTSATIRRPIPGPSTMSMPLRRYFSSSKLSRPRYACKRSLIINN